MRKILFTLLFLCFTCSLSSNQSSKYNHYWTKLESEEMIKRLGYFAIKDGELLRSYIGTCGWECWIGAGSERELLDLLLPASKLAPEQIFVVYRGDTATYILPVVKNNPDLMFLFPSSRDYYPVNALRLPSPYVSDYHDEGEEEYDFICTKYDHLCTDWNAKSNSLAWRGLSSSNYPEQYYRGVRENIVNTLKDHPKCDVGFSGSAYLKDNELSNRLSPEQQSKHKVLLALDGWGWPGSLSWNIRSGSLIIISSKDWCGYMDILEEGKHYISANETNIKEVVDWAFSHEKEAKEIAQNCKEFAAKEFTPDKMRTRLLELFRKANQRQEAQTFTFNNYQVNAESMEFLQINEWMLRSYITSCFDSLGVLYRIQPNYSGISLLDVEVSYDGFEKLKNYLSTLHYWSMHTRSGYSDGRGIPMFWQLATNHRGETIIQLHYISSEFMYTEGMPWCANISVN